MAEYYNVQELTYAALEFVALYKESMDGIGMSLDRLLNLHFHSKNQLYWAGYSVVEILTTCGYDCNCNEIDFIAGCLRYEIRCVRDMLGEYDPLQVILGISKLDPPTKKTLSRQ